jgi:hypothetical protein
MTKNKLIDLNDHLFAQIERLSDEEISNEELEKEVGRSEAIVKVSDQIIKTASVSVQAAKLKFMHGDFMGRTLNETAPMLAPKKTIKTIEGEKNDGKTD